ncbi:NUDIX hydrolase [Roseospira marina]|uniref:GDP-mannose pyrophosphatase n=1 Tax=Roseospira marina TaxID=140057 RepID=A0A5M6I810_9PROT|nr:NUDIX hydrolase [Roseospira marina]KAA5603879.1 NUDIX hydrolase [Roseospira marina]MBB4313743.1 8-oxo-dGTP pyrophosphatase MutT (NUDIX family) [Roseospira marina]MBB5086905.1 8-oxo-dGTP pyrophosphatase MutT (NUDIX family) [Roseospira marina]
MPSDPPDSPWTTQSERAIYANPWITVTEYGVLTPAGTPGIYGVVRFRNVAVCVLPVAADGTVTLVGQFRYPLQAYSWELPEGGCPVGTDPLDAARRELREETGQIAGGWSEILRLHLSNCVSDEAGVSFLAWNLAEGPSDPDETERLEVRRVPFVEAVRMAETGAITDGHSIATLFRARLMALEGRLPPAVADALAY